MKKLLIISPEAKLISDLQQSLAQVKDHGRALILRQYPSLRQVEELLRDQTVKRVIVGLSEPERALGLIEQLHNSYPDAVVAAAHTIVSADLVQKVLEKGACEYLGQPFEVKRLQEMLKRQPQKVGVTNGGRLIGFLPAHGGCGASTVAMHLAAALAQEGAKKVLLMDFDFHSGALDFRLGLKPKFTFADAMKCTEQLDEQWGEIVCRYKGFDVLSAPSYSKIPTQYLAQAPEVMNSAMRNYEWVISDLPPAVYTSCRDTLTQAEAVYVVLTPELVSLHLAQRKVQELRDLGVKSEAMRLLVNRVNGKEFLDFKEMEQVLGIPVTWSLSNDYKALTKACFDCSLVPANSELGKQFRDFARHNMGLPAHAAAPRSSWKGLFTHADAKVRTPSRESVVKSHVELLQVANTIPC
jgi:pilus assembly protein CpaE